MKTFYKLNFSTVCAEDGGVNLKIRGNRKTERKGFILMLCNAKPPLLFTIHFYLFS